MNRSSCLLIKPHLQKQTLVSIWLRSPNLLNSDLKNLYFVCVEPDTCFNGNCASFRAYPSGYESNSVHYLWVVFAILCKLLVIDKYANSVLSGSDFTDFLFPSLPLQFRPRLFLNSTALYSTYISTVPASFGEVVRAAWLLHITCVK